MLNAHNTIILTLNNNSNFNIVTDTSTQPTKASEFCIYENVKVKN